LSSLDSEYTQEHESNCWEFHPIIKSKNKS
jgi:hypothetical protein